MKKIRHNEEVKYNDTSKFPDKLKPAEGMRSINLFSMFDVAFMEAYGFNSKEYDTFCEKATDEEMEIIFNVESKSTFTAKRKALEIINKYKALAYE